MVRLIAATAFVALLSPTAAFAARPVPGASYLIQHRSFDADRGSFVRDNVFSINANASAFGDSAPASVPLSDSADPAAPNPPRSLPSVIEVGARCLGVGNDTYTGYDLNGVPVASDGSFSVDVHNQPSDAYGGPKSTKLAEFHLRGKFVTPTTVSGWLSEVRYLPVPRPAFAGAAATTRRIVYCHTGKRKSRYRVPFTGRQRPIQWIVDKTCFLRLFPRC